VSSQTVTLIVFVCVFGGAVLGIVLRSTLPEEQLSAASRDVVKLAMGTIATMTAVILGLLVASAKGYYDTQNSELTQMSARIALLDRILGHYGPEAKQARNALRDVTAGMLERLWRRDAPLAKAAPTGSGEGLYDEIQALTPQNDSQRFGRSQALNLAMQVGETRWLMFEQASNAVSMPLLLVMIFSLSITFASFSLHAAPNPTVIVTLVLCALAVALTLFLILEMYSPFQGWIQIPSAPLRNALEQLGR
jgi:hypothetical protein